MIPEVSLRSAPSAPPSVDDDAQALWKWTGVLAHAWGVLAIGAVAGGLLGWFASARSASVFEAVATVVLNPPKERGALFTPTAVKALFTSATVVSGVVSELGLDREPFSLTPDAFRSRALIVEEVPTTNTTRLRVRLSNPDTAARAANAVAQRTIELTSRAWRDAAEADGRVLDKQLATARQELSKAEQGWLAARVSGEKLSAAGIRVPRAVGGDRERVSHGTDDKPLADRLAETAGGGGQGVAADRYLEQLELLRLENEVQVRRDVFMDVADKLERVRLELAATPSPLQLVEPALVPKYPLAGTAKRTVALGVLAGLVLAACFVVSREWRLAGRR